MISSTARTIQPLSTSQMVNIPSTRPIHTEFETPKRQMATQSALGSIISSDPMWMNADVDELDDEEEPELPQLHFQYQGDLKPKVEEVDKVDIKPNVDLYRHVKKESMEYMSRNDFGVEEEGDRRQSREKDEKENNRYNHGGSTTALGIGKPRAFSRSYHDSSETHTPPQGVSGSGFSARSSASSARVASLTDASTASQSSMEPTPPSAYGHGYLARSSLSSNGSGGSGGSGSGDRPARTYGGSSSSRTFQRHVSAPLGRHWPAREDKSRDTEEMSTSTSTGHSDTNTLTQTATIRPKLVKTTSASSVHEERDSVRPLARSTFVTPGMTDRKLGPGGTLGSSTRRFVNLSQFGGPARRVKPGEEVPEEDQELHTPVLMPSPKRDSPPTHAVGTPEQSEAGPSKQMSLSPGPSPEPAPRFVHRRSPPMVRRQGKEPALPEVIEHLEPESRHNRARSGSPTAVDMPWDQRSRPQPSRRQEPELPSRHSRYESRTERPAPQPPRPIETPHRPPDLPYFPPVSRNHTTPPRPVFHPPAPAHQPMQSEVRPYTQTAPLPAVVEPSRQTAPAPPQAQPQDMNKRGFIVNGVYYDRVGLLGKGGSSKVYSIMCPTQRTILALKRVTLDRADHETYQSYTNEIELLKRLKGHDRIIQLVDHQITFGPNNRPKVLLMVMECGEIDFSMLLDEQRGKPLNFNFVGLYWQQMLQAVHAVHLENVVHTDLKPANFVLVKGRLKIIDFGIAKAVANDTVNIQRDQQIGTVNYMSPEAISKMTNLNVLKLSYPSDVWSLGCILYQMIYGSAPFAHIPGGPLTKMNCIADPKHRIEYPAEAIPRGATSQQGQPVDPQSMAVAVMPSAIDTMRHCLAYNKDQRLTIPKLLEHEFLQPTLTPLSALPAGTTPISREQMVRMVEWVMKEGEGKTADDLGSDLHNQLMNLNRQGMA